MKWLSNVGQLSTSSQGLEVEIVDIELSIKAKDVEMFVRGYFIHGLRRPSLRPGESPAGCIKDLDICPPHKKIYIYIDFYITKKKK